MREASTSLFIIYKLTLGDGIEWLYDSSGPLWKGDIWAETLKDGGKGGHVKDAVDEEQGRVTASAEDPWYWSKDGKKTRDAGAIWMIYRAGEGEVRKLRRGQVM